MGVTLLIMLWLTAALIIFAAARSSAERSQRSTGSSRQLGLPAGPPQRSTPAAEPRRSRSAMRPTAPTETAVERPKAQSNRRAADDLATAGVVRINSAGVEELCRLPGVGRRAAERIASYRDRAGGFRSLDELQAVEGFNRERVLRLSERAAL